MIRNLLVSIIAVLSLATTAYSGTPASLGYPWAPHQSTGGISFAPVNKKFIGAKNDGSPGETVGFVNDWFNTPTESLLWNSDGSFTFNSSATFLGSINSVPAGTIDARIPPYNVTPGGVVENCLDPLSGIPRAITDLAAAGGGVIQLPVGTIKCTNLLTLQSNIILQGHGKNVTILDFSLYADPLQVITANGTIDPVNLLTVNVAQGDTTINVTNGAEFSTGDRVLLATRQAAPPDAVNIFHGFPGITGLKGEIAVVDSVAVNQVLLRSRTLDSYVVGPNVGLSKLHMVTNIGIKNLTVKRETQQLLAKEGILVNWVEGIIIQNVGVQYATNSSINLDNVIDGYVSGCSIEHAFYAGASTGYGIVVSDASRNIRADNNYIRDFRVGLQSGKGGSGIGGIPRFVIYSNNTIIQEENAAVTAGAIETHLPSEHFVISGNTIWAGGVGGSRGILSDAPYTLIDHNVIYGRSGIGVGLSSFASTGRTSPGVVVSNNMITIAGNTIADFGVLVSSSFTRVVNNSITNMDAIGNIGIRVTANEASQPIQGVSVDSNSIYNMTPCVGGAGIQAIGLQNGSITNNFVYRPCTGNAITVSANVATNSANVSVFSNHAVDDQAIPTMARGLSIDAGATGITLGSNTFAGFTVRSVEATASNFSTVVVFDGPQQGIEVADPAAPEANRAIMYVRDNGGGKTQLCARFNTGAVQCFATEP